MELRGAVAAMGVVAGAARSAYVDIDRRRLHATPPVIPPLTTPVAA